MATNRARQTNYIIIALKHRTGANCIIIIIIITTAAATIASRPARRFRLLSSH